ncbi:MAG: polysaccharide deacetylase family protein [Bacillota bacterium]|nr:polysaccharide deacetylase family protein [Bacillota bacterium]
MFYIKYRQFLIFTGIVVFLITILILVGHFHFKTGNINQNNGNHGNEITNSNEDTNLQEDSGNAKNSKSNKNKTMTILMYHHVSDEVKGEKYYFVSPSAFFDQMKYLNDNGYTALTFENFKDFNKYKKPVMITFDDGYMDNYAYAYPILKRFNIKATMFLITGSLNKPDYLTTDVVKEMSGLVSFQSHTVNHINLSLSDENTIEKECCQSKNDIEKILSRKINTIAYPFGLYNANTVNIAKKYYDYCVTGNVGVYKKGDITYILNRMPVANADSLASFAKKVE